MSMVNRNRTVKVIVVNVRVIAGFVVSQLIAQLEAFMRRRHDIHPRRAL